MNSLTSIIILITVDEFLLGDRDKFASFRENSSLERPCSRKRPAGTAGFWGNGVRYHLYLARDEHIVVLNGMHLDYKVLLL
jgi:hypothetical protein